jgi:hypothetical protein
VALFAGKQPLTPDPTMRHESPGITSGTQPVYVGGQPGQTQPTVQLWLTPLWKLERG